MLAFDKTGNLYGGTAGDVQCTKGNIYRCGSVFRLSAGSWTFSTVHRFTGGKGGEGASGLITDAGSLYGNAGVGGSQQVGFVFEMQP